MEKDKLYREKNLNKTFKYGLVGGVAGACIGIPGVGAGIGMAYANKDEINKYIYK